MPQGAISRSLAVGNGPGQDRMHPVRAVQVFGGMGLLTEGPVERIFRYVRMLRIVEGTSEIQRMIIARNLCL